MLERERGSQAESEFLRSFSRGDLTLAELTVEDTDRMAELVDTYADLRLGGVDASVVAIAERLNVAAVATLIGVLSPEDGRSYEYALGRATASGRRLAVMA